MFFHRFGKFDVGRFTLRTNPQSCKYIHYLQRNNYGAIKTCVPCNTIIIISAEESTHHKGDGPERNERIGFDSDDHGQTFENPAVAGEYKLSWHCICKYRG